MPNYKKMYFALFNAVTDAIQDLQSAQQKGEEAYIESKDSHLLVLPVKVEKKKRPPNNR